MRADRGRTAAARALTWQLVSLVVLAVTVATLCAVLVTRPAALGRGTVPATSFTPTPLARPQIIAGFVGDSWTGGSDMGGHGAANWSAIVSAHYGWRDVPFAVGGTGWLDGGHTGDTYGSPLRLSEVERTRPDILFITNGINDLDIAGTSDTVQERLDQIPAAVAKGLARYRAELPDSQIVLIGIIPPNGTSRGQVATERKLDVIARRYRVHVIDQSDAGWFDGSDHRFIGRDHFHPTDAGHRYLASRVIGRLDALDAASWPQVYRNWTQAEHP